MVIKVRGFKICLRKVFLASYGVLMFLFGALTASSFFSVNSKQLDDGYVGEYTQEFVHSSDGSSSKMESILVKSSYQETAGGSYYGGNNVEKSHTDMADITANGGGVSDIFDGSLSEPSSLVKPDILVASLSDVPDLKIFGKPNFTSDTNNISAGAEQDIIILASRQGSKEQETIKIGESRNKKLSKPVLNFGELKFNISLERGEVLAQAFERNGFSKAGAFLIASEVAKQYDPRYIRTSDVFEVTARKLQFGDLGNLGKSSRGKFTINKANFGYPYILDSIKKNEKTTEFIINLSDGGSLSSFKNEKSITKQTYIAMGKIENSLYKMAESYRIPISILAKSINVLSYDVDFQREIRRGDEFTVFYEIELDEFGNQVSNGEITYVRLKLTDRDIELFSHIDGKSGKTEFFSADGVSVRRSLMKTPIDGAVISSHFGNRKHPILGYTKLHKGVDFAAPTGTPVFVAGDGIIEEIGRKGTYGNYVRIKHNNKYQTAYAHLHSFNKSMRKGKRVKQGEVVAYVGSTGRSTGPHLHYEILVNGKHVNPMLLKLPASKKLTGKERADFMKSKRFIKNQIVKFIDKPIDGNETL